MPTCHLRWNRVSMTAGLSPVACKFQTITKINSWHRCYSYPPHPTAPSSPSSAYNKGFLLSLSLFEKEWNSCQPRASSGSSTDLLVWFLLSPLPFSMETVNMPTCIYVCKEDSSAEHMGSGPAASRLCSQEGHGLATQDYTNLAQGGGSLSRDTLTNTP